MKFIPRAHRPEGSIPPESTAARDPRPSFSRRRFLEGSAVAAAAAAIPAALLTEIGTAKAAVLPQSVILDALSGVVAFVVPGQDAFSEQQGLTMPRPGGVDGNATLPLMFGLDQAGLAPPPFDALSELVAFILANVTTYVNPAPSGPFASPFANLSFGEKAAVFSIMESGAAGPELAPLANSLLTYAALMSFSEAGEFDPFTGTLSGTPVGWTISGYGGVSDGHADFQGYYLGRRAALP